MTPIRGPEVETTRRGVAGAFWDLLTEDQREIITMVTAGLTQDEIAKERGTSRSAIAQMLQRIRRKAQKHRELRAG